MYIKDFLLHTYYIKDNIFRGWIGTNFQWQCDKVKQGLCGTTRKEYRYSAKTSSMAQLLLAGSCHFLN